MVLTTLKDGMETAMKRLLDAANAQVTTSYRIGQHLDPQQKAEEDLAYFERVFDDTERCMRQYRAERRRRVNDLQLIHRLPDELLVRILFLSLQNPNIRNYYGRLRHRSLVCVRWAEVIESTPSFWSVAHSANAKPPLDKVLVKSRNTSLDVAYDALDLREPSFFDQIRPNSHRWRSLELFKADEHILGSMMALSLPILEDLYILSGEIPPDVDPSSGRLRHVRLESVSLKWPVQMLQALETLELSNLWPMGLSTAQLIEMLRLSPGLVELTLFRTDADETTMLLPDDTAPIPLDHLLRLHISELAGLLVRDLLTYIRVPRCRSLSVRDHYGPDNPSATILLASPIRAILEETGWLRITWMDSLSLISKPLSGNSSEQNPICLHISPIDAPPAEFLPSIIPILHSIHPPPEVEVDISARTYPSIPLDMAWPLFDSPLPVTSLRLWGPGLEPFIEHMSSPTAGSHRTPRSFPLPGLRTITINDSDVGADLLLRMVRSRYLGEESGRSVADGRSKAGDGQEEPVPESPSPLEYVRFNGRHNLRRLDVEQLESIMGRGTIRLDHNLGLQEDHEEGGDVWLDF